MAEEQGSETTPEAASGEASGETAAETAAQAAALPPRGEVLQPGLLWPRVSWSSGRFDWLGWLAFAGLALSLIFTLVGASSFLFKPFRPLALGLGLAGLGLLNLWTRWSSLKKWGGDAGESWRNGLFGLLLLFYFGMGLAFGLQAAGVLAGKAAGGLIFFGIIFLCFYLAITYLYELTFNWKQASGGLFLWMGLVLQVSSLILFRKFFLIPAGLLCLVALSLAGDAVRRGALRHVPALSRLLLAATLALSVPLFSFLYQEHQVGRQPIRSFTKLAGGLHSTLANLQWSPAVRRHDDLDSSKRKPVDKFSSKISFTTLEGGNWAGERVFAVYDAVTGVGRRYNLSTDFMGASWSPTADHLVYCSSVPGSDATNLWLFNLSDAALKAMKAGVDKNKLMSLPAPKLLAPQRVWANPFGQVWSKDGRTLLLNIISKASPRIIEYNVASGNSKVIVRGSSFYPSWSPDGKAISFVRKKGPLHWSVMVTDKAGHNAKEIFTTREGEILPPVWAPNSQRIGFILKKAKSYSIYTIGRRGAGPLHFFATEDMLSTLQWSPSSNKVAFFVHRKGTEKDQLWSAHQDGLHPELLYEGEGPLNHLSWSPNGQFLAFEERIRRWTVAPDLYSVLVIDTKDMEPKEVLPYRLFSRNPVFSPNGTVLAFVANETRWLPGGKMGIWLAKFDE